MEALKGSEFVRKVQGLAKKKGVRFEHKAERGKGSHSTLYLGDKRTTVRNLKDELKTGTLHAMLKQLGIQDSDLN
jgi:mRNA interferase HicA